MVRSARPRRETSGPRRNPGLKPRIALDVAAIAIAAGSAVAISREVAERELLGFDVSVPLALHSVGPILDVPARFITMLGNGVAVFAIAGIAAALLALRGARSWAWGVAFVAIGAGLIDLVLKLAFGRERPELWARPPVAGFAFPSGHAMESAAVYFYLAAAVRAVAPPYGLLAIVVSVLLVAAIALSRVVLGVHWPSDVLGGVAIGYLLQRLCALWASRATKFAPADR